MSLPYQRTPWDLAVAVILAAAAAFALSAWRRDTAHPERHPELGLCWLLLAGGFLYLGLDEAASLHEKIGTRLTIWGVPTPGVVNHLDDAVVASYGAIGLAVIATNWRELSLTPRPTLLLMAGLAVTAVSIGIDTLAPVEGWSPIVEEACEISASLLLCLAAWARTRVTVSMVMPGRLEQTEARYPVSY